MSKGRGKRQSKQPQMSWLTITLGVIAGVLFVALIAFLVQPPRVITSFQQCKDAGGSVMESYPEQCLIGGTTFTNDTQSATGSAYVGLTEADALAKAKQDDVPSRVVERDGKDLAVTMDFVFGRYNLFVKDGKVYKVEVEGYATDTQ